MIVPMKKVSLIIEGVKKKEALKALRRLGILHIEITEGGGEALSVLQQRLHLLEGALYTVGKKDKVAQVEITTEEALRIAEEIASVDEEKNQTLKEARALQGELDSLRSWGDIDPAHIEALSLAGVTLSFYEMPKKEYLAISQALDTVKIGASRSSVRFMVREAGADADKEALSSILSYRLRLPEVSTEQMRQRLSALTEKMAALDEKMRAYAVYAGGILQAKRAIEKEIEFETYATGMGEAALSANGDTAPTVSYFEGYVEAKNLAGLKKAAKENAWGLVVSEPTEEDNVPTKLENNKLVSLIYPLTDFLGTVPGYFEYDISGWFLTFILIFFGIIFGDGGYGLLICAVAGALILKSAVSKKPIPPAFLLVGLFGLSTVVWGTLTCTWFGLAPEQLPLWLQKISVPVISNVYADTVWYPFWTNGEAGLSTAQNLQIFCFSLALVQLTVAHIKGAIRNRRSLKILGDVGSILQLMGLYYLVLSFVVNAEVFSFGLVIGGVPVGTLAIAMIGGGFLLSFVFSNYEGSLLKSVLASLANIVSVLLGVVNVFSDIVSYIRLWAVGLAGAAISATVNALAGPFFGNLLLAFVAIVLLVFGHGLNMILNVLSVIVHGIRLNTLEFSSHLDMSWSGHKFKPFEE